MNTAENSPFATLKPNIKGNTRIRPPQQEAYQALSEHFGSQNENREVGIVLPVGCGKSGAIALTPFAFKSRRTLVIAPSVSIAEQLYNNFNPSNDSMFYQKCSVISAPFPEPAEIRGEKTNKSDLDEAHVVITNIQQLQREDNKWLKSLPTDYFDLIVFDEGHHSVASSWETLKEKFPQARIVNFSATPMRSDGQIMAGEIIYSYPVAEAIKMGYVKRLKAVQLNPRTLRYVRRDGEEEIEVSLEEVIKLGEEDADFRRSIVTSKESLDTIVDASIQELRKLREKTKEKRLKIIASALNYEHCIQIKKEFQSKGLKADYVHSNEDSKQNDKIIKKLHNHELDVIVQVRKLGEGFDHPYLSVAAVFSIFSNLSPFVQFVGRIMRVIDQKEPNAPSNQGVVVFHAGANIARQWSDFKKFSEADQDYFDQLLPIESFDPTSDQSERVYSPHIDYTDGIDIKSQSEIQLQEIDLLQEEDRKAIEQLKRSGYIQGDFDPEKQILKPVQAPKQAQRQALRKQLDELIKTKSVQVLRKNKFNPEGHDLDKSRTGKSNFIVMKPIIDRYVNSFLGKEPGTRGNLSLNEVQRAISSLNEITKEAEAEVFHGN